MEARNRPKNRKQLVVTVVGRRLTMVCNPPPSGMGAGHCSPRSAALKQQHKRGQRLIAALAGLQPAGYYPFFSALPGLIESRRIVRTRFAIRRFGKMRASAIRRFGDSAIPRDQRDPSKHLELDDSARRRRG